MKLIQPGNSKLNNTFMFNLPATKLYANANFVRIKHTLKVIIVLCAKRIKDADENTTYTSRIYK